METLFFVLFPLVWVLTCLIGALGVRFRQTAWPRAMLIASMMAATFAVCGGSPDAQIGIAFISGVIAFVALDAYGVRAAARAAAASKRADGHDATPAARTVDPRAESLAANRKPRSDFGSSRAKSPAAGASTKSAARSRPGADQKPSSASLWTQTSRYELERRESETEGAGQPSAERAAKPAGAARKPQTRARRQEPPRGPVEIIMPAERAVLRRRSQGRGYWIARTTRGEVEVYLPPGSEAYPGHPVSIIVKPNGTLLGVPLTMPH